jgi:hypothetical protein
LLAVSVTARLLNRPSTRSAAEEPALAADPPDRAAPADARAPERLAAVDRGREEELGLARLPEFLFERDAGADLLALAADLLRGVALELELFLAVLELPVDLRDEAFEPLDERERAPEADEPEAGEPEADEPLLEPDDVRFLMLRRLEPLSFSTAISSSHRDRRSGSARRPPSTRGQEKPANGLPHPRRVYTRRPTTRFMWSPLIATSGARFTTARPTSQTLGEIIHMVSLLSTA